MPISKVITNGFAVLDILAENPNLPIGLSKISEKLNISPSRCAFLMKALVDTGAAEQHRHKGGYTLGPKIFHLSRNGMFRKDIIDTARPLMHEFSYKTGEATVLIAMLHAERCMLTSTEGNHDVTIGTSFLHSNQIYGLATGRLLLACLPKPIRQRRIKELGIPGPEWPGVDSIRELSKALNKIRDAGEVIENDRPDLVQLAFLVHDPLRVPLALGIPVPRFRFDDNHREKICQQGRELADNITHAINPPFPSTMKRQEK